MLDPLRQEIATSAHTLVVKVGTRVLTQNDGTLDLAQIAAVSDQVADLADAGHRVVLVSSGAVGAGLGRLGLKRRPADLAQLQAVAALGQSRLIEAYNRALETRGHHAAQILLTADDFHDRTRYLNIRNTLSALFRYGAIPVINENDTVRVDELQLQVGDNDRLAAMVTNLIRAPLLVILSDVEGLYDGDPNDPSSQLIPIVREVNDTLRDSAGGVRREPGSAVLSVGGMRTKLEAARITTAAGESLIIANGRRPRVLAEIMEGQDVGTLFLALGASITSRKRWIGFVASAKGRLVLDSGAARAIVQQGRSLLAVGVASVEGEFGKGDVVVLCDGGGTELARGLVNYSAAETRRIAGQPTERIADILGHRPYDEVVHRDNLVQFG